MNYKTPCYNKDGNFIGTGYIYEPSVTTYAYKDFINKSYTIPYWIWDQINDCIEKYTVEEYIKLFPNEETPLYLGYTVDCEGEGGCTIQIWDIYGDRDSKVVLSVQASKYISIHDTFMYMFRDILRFCLVRYPKDPYILRILKYIFNKNPELKNTRWYHNESKNIFENK